MYWPEADFKISEIVKFGPLLAQKRQNWWKFFYLQTPKKGVYWPFLAMIPGTPSQGIPKQLEFAVLERLYQVSPPGRTNKAFFWAFADKRIFPNFAFFGPKVDQICVFPKFWNQPQVNTYLDYQNLKFGQKMFIVAKVILESHNFLWMHTVLKQMDNLWQQKQFWVHFNSY